ncbi:hypothetical protein QLX08_002889 [Tetragonisca angustula]|uniref:Carboxylesterase type B domain-containing protein n=1 Tax=Tetragonisca angustula TaxID=166442 RepID=A0AAW1A8I2_9HYME
MRTSSSSSPRKRKHLSPLDPIERRLPPLDNSLGLSFLLRDARVDDVFQRCLWPSGVADADREARSPGRSNVGCSTSGGEGECRSPSRDGSVETRYESRSKKCLATMVVFLGLLCGHWCSGGAEALAGSQKYSTRTIRTRYGTLRGVEDRSSTFVEAYYGVPYATPPVGSLRYMPPVTPTPWRGIKLADTMPPACPQKPPEPDSSQPRSKRAHLERLAPLLANQSEDCLYLNLYVPKPPHGESLLFGFS